MKKKIKKINKNIGKSIKRKNKKNYSFPFFTIISGFLILLVVGFLIFTNINVALKKVELTERTEELRKEVQTLEQKRQELQAKIARAEDPDFLEERLREELGLKKPGEEVVVIVSSPEKEVEEPVKVEKTFWQKIQNWFLAF